MRGAHTLAVSHLPSISIISIAQTGISQCKKPAFVLVHPVTLASVTAIPPVIQHLHQSKMKKVHHRYHHLLRRTIVSTLATKLKITRAILALAAPAIAATLSKFMTTSAKMTVLTARSAMGWHLSRAKITITDQQNPSVRASTANFSLNPDKLQNFILLSHSISVTESD